ncbi:type IV secretory system conjugative DNA transfer family protein [Spirosoma pollinicola]|uniref:Mobilization protein n=1 Tax=Spirosoma pollinicola TaxID=2057025 RepID=A0A2K8Z9D2_9BACT|nr:type IV secretory system conjugative DNA transfer family protein [Spirosoma pollinicola]AUD06486.1 hypothetical protein CWM47_34365 [Spirosoma pollinicola]
MFKLGSIAGYIFGLVAIPILIYIAASVIIKFLIISVGFPRIVGDVVGGIGGFLPAGYIVYRRMKGNGRTEIQSASQVTKTGIKVKDYVFGIRTTKGIIKIVNPFAGLFVVAGPGAGKSYGVIEPIITQAIKKGFTGLVYDYKFPSFAQVVQAAAKDTKAKAYYVNFDDLTRSHRVNPIHPDLIITKSHAESAADVIIKNLIKGETNFFVSSATAYLGGIIWFLREEYPEYCTLPHVLNLAAESVKQVVPLISKNEEVRISVASLKTAIDENSSKQLTGVVSTLQDALGKINTRSICYVLSGNDFTLDLNNPDDPKIMVIGNNDELKPVYGPVISLIVANTIRKLNKKGKLPSIVCLDEAPTLFIPEFSNLPATGRENKIVTLFGAQNFSQIDTMYGPQEKDSILNTLSNRFYGRMPHEPSAEYVVKTWGKEYVEQRSQSISQVRLGEVSASKSDSYSLVHRDRVEVQDVMNLKQGEFFGQLVESDVSYFRTQLKPDPIDRQPIPAFKEVTEADVKANYKKVAEDIRNLLAGPVPKPSNPSGPNSKPKDEF